MPLDNVKRPARELLDAYTEWVDSIQAWSAKLDASLKHGLSEADVADAKDMIADWQACNKVVLATVGEIKRIHSEAEKMNSVMNRLQKLHEDFFKLKGKLITSNKNSKGEEFHTLHNIATQKKVPVEKLPNGNFKDPATGKIYSKDGARISK